MLQSLAVCFANACMLALQWLKMCFSHCLHAAVTEGCSGGPSPLLAPHSAGWSQPCSTTDKLPVDSQCAAVCTANATGPGYIATCMALQNPNGTAGQYWSITGHCTGTCVQCSTCNGMWPQPRPMFVHIDQQIEQLAKVVDSSAKPAVVHSCCCCE